MKRSQGCLVGMLVLLFSCQQPTSEVSSEKLFSLLPPSYTGIDFQNPVVETKDENHIINDMLISGAGVAVGDINNDGLADLYFTGNQVADRLYLNKGNLKFEDITKKAGIEHDGVWSSGVTFADVNNDGLQDIYVTKYAYGQSQLGENRLYINTGDLTFEERAAEWGLADRGFSVQATFFDFDMDGWLDLYLLNQPPSTGNRRGNKVTLFRLKSIYYTDKVYRNTGEGSYHDATDWCGVNNLAFGLSATVGDFNNDMLPDFYVANDYEKPDHLYINKGQGRFANQANQSLKHISNFSMGTDVADYDNDGYLDIVVVDMVPEDHKRIKTNMGGMDPKAFWEVVDKGWHYQYMFNTLQKNNGNGTFSEIAHLAGVSNTDWSWSALFGDFDNDGWKDLFITNGVKRAMRNSDLSQNYNQTLDSIEAEAKIQGKDWWDMIDLMEMVEMAPVEKLTNYIFKNQGDLTFEKKSEEWGLDLPTLSYGAAYADLDNDGDLELIINNTDDYAYVYRNNSVEKDKGNYLRFQIKNEDGGPAYGAKVRLFKQDKFWQLQELNNTRGYKSKSEDVMHFGLGASTTVDKVEVTWPYGKQTVLEDVEANQIIVLDPSQAEGELKATPAKSYLFQEVTADVGIRHRHRENNYDDFELEVLLPHKMSNFGPGLTVGDIDNDGLEDFYVGGAAGVAGTLYRQQRSGTFQPVPQSSLQADAASEDLGAAFFDSDSDGDLDLYVVSGGNEFKEGAGELQDRLYLNNGSGVFTKSNNLPRITASGSCVVPGDFDGDGDLDLFIGGRINPQQYPLPGQSYLLENQGGVFKDVTQRVAPALSRVGLVTDALWTDLNQDGSLDLAVTGEWMTVKIFESQNGTLTDVTEQAGLEEQTGWYYSLAVADFDKDGDQDLIAGNLGLNYKYKASENEPFEIYSSDFDQNGTRDIVLGYYEHGELYPLRGKSCSTQQIPGLQQQFPTYLEFGEANLRDVYGAQLDSALNYKARTFATVYLENQGDGSFSTRALPLEAQFSSVNSIITSDLDQDGHLDLLIAGNLYGAEIETPRNDAGMGLFLKGDGTGNFNPVPLVESGFFAPHDAKQMRAINLGSGANQRKALLVANNQQWMQAIAIMPEAVQDSLISLR